MANEPVSDRVWPTELAAVWFAANFFYQASFKRQKEFIGWVFKRPDGTFGISEPNVGTFERAKPPEGGVPEDADVVAVWHTHIPLTVTRMGKVFGLLSEALGAMTTGSFEDFSEDDRDMARDFTEVGLKKAGHRVPIYLITATRIKRFTPGLKREEKSWAKEPPGRMSQRW